MTLRLVALTNNHKAIPLTMTNSSDAITVVISRGFIPREEVFSAERSDSDFAGDVTIFGEYGKVCLSSGGG
jgi:cytochrome oxidase assembly protein ShyY1